MSKSTQQSKANIQKLITLERAQKLDLLIHLISNLRQSLIICGPEGIGKTTILDAMLENNNDSWPICLLQGTSSLSFESILDKFSQQLTQLLPGHAGQDLSAILENYNKQNQKIVLIVDDAGVLVPGLVSALIEFANANTSLRLVLSLTYDELHVKNSSDTIIDECHLIEIPPITKKQCTDFLQNLSVQPGAAISFNAVTERLVDNLYRQTHGIPGKIVTELPRLVSYKLATGLKWGAGSFVIIAIVCAIGLLYFNRPESQMAESLIKKKPVAVETVSIEVENEKNEVLSREDIIVELAEKESLTTKEKATETTESVAKKEKDKQEDAITEKQVVVDKSKKTVPESKTEAAETIEPVQVTTETAEAKKKKDKQEDATTEKQVVVDKSKKTVPESKTEAAEITEPVQATTEIAEAKKKKDKQEDATTEKQVVVDKSKKTVPESKIVEAVLDDTAWVSSQSAENYTMQLMVLSKRQSVEDLLKKYQHHKDLLKSFLIKNKDQNKYVVIYGSYKTSADATKAKQTLPTAFRKAWVRKFKVLQKQIKAN